MSIISKSILFLIFLILITLCKYYLDNYFFKGSKIYCNKTIKSILSLIIVSSTIISCSSYKDYSNQVSILNENSIQSFTLENNKLHIPTLINNESGIFLFDTGAQSSALLDSMFLQKINKNNDLKKGTKIVGANGVTIQSYNFVSSTANSGFFTSKNKIFRFIKILKQKTKYCNEVHPNNIGIIGIDFIENSELPVLLDFEKSRIEILNKDFTFQNYTKSSAKIKTLGSKIILPLVINNKKIDFLFDTGNNGGLIIKNEDFKSSKQPNVEFNTLIETVNGISSQKIKSYYNADIIFNETEKINCKISVFDNLHINTLGIKFIKKFNWIFDFKNNVVYFKKINNIENTDIEIPPFTIQSIAVNSKLLVGFKLNTDNNNFNINDEIISVNNNIITPENVCEMQNLLNSKPNWDELKIEIKKN
ncbi:hypothetical protein G6N05_14775 [Flavobacterium sp. F372]|uniref:Peptidase A2 domain-containing protein n=1 Tax=Flavobacterium bernardetii TaxID=2813823 RepID=A0ABR7IZN9_9FLAO|nr:hypothetical protein [Flavobacterium bernardetii]MBC5835235.1 hypothetical protein [Flavobacterium bernardetii]NHF71376.1 hypothetical protein [Flavobacterium bernardetii]